jgi:hypothetical protein
MTGYDFCQMLFPVTYISFFALPVQLPALQIRISPSGLTDQSLQCLDPQRFVPLTQSKEHDLLRIRNFGQYQSK